MTDQSFNGDMIPDSEIDISPGQPQSFSQQDDNVEIVETKRMKTDQSFDNEIVPDSDVDISPEQPQSFSQQDDSVEIVKAKRMKADQSFDSVIVPDSEIEQSFSQHESRPLEICRISETFLVDARKMTTATYNWQAADKVIGWRLSGQIDDAEMLRLAAQHRLDSDMLSRARHRYEVYLLFGRSTRNLKEFLELANLFFVGRLDMMPE